MGIKAVSPVNVPDRLAIQQVTAVFLETRHQEFSAFLPMTATVSPAGMVSTLRNVPPGPV